MFRKLVGYNGYNADCSSSLTYPILLHKKKQNTGRGSSNSLSSHLCDHFIGVRSDIERFDKKFVTSPCEQWDLEQFNHVQRRGSMVETNHCPTYLALERN